KDRPKKKSKPVASSDEKGKDKKKRPRKRIENRGKPTEGTNPATGTGEGQARPGSARPGQGSARPGQGASAGARPGQGTRPGQAGGQGVGRPGARPSGTANRGGTSGNRPAQGTSRFQKAEPTQKEIQDQMKQTLARLQGGGKTGGGRSKNRRDKRSERGKELVEGQDETKVLRVT